MNFSERYGHYRAQFEGMLSAACADMKFFPEILSESIQYSLLAGGKRLRPVLFLATLDALGRELPAEADIAVAIECIHTYSLIHDDLPGMDDDDFRRGMPSNHRKFGVGNAILAGDALLSHAFELLFSAAERGAGQLAAARLIAHAAGPCGMIAGQSADLLYGEKEDAGEGELLFIHAHKTGEMIAAPLGAAGCIAGREVDRLLRFGNELGLLFQLTDDLLDSGEEGRLTALKVYGEERARRRVEACSEECKSILQGAGFDTEFLCGAVDFVRMRQN